jgi:hypothetical protein
MAGLLVALGASACVNDYSLDFGGAPTKVQASPETMFVTSGAAAKALLLRLVNDRNQSVPAEWTITNVPAGLTVELDTEYRPDYVNPEQELVPDAVQTQHRYFVTADMPTGGMATFTVSSQGFSQQITVRVLPTDLGAALSSTAPALGEEVTITAPASLSFTDESEVSIPGGGDAVIVSQSADAITFIPIPGSSGPATVTGVILDYAPTLDPRTLETTSSIDVPAVNSIPLQFSATTPLTPVTLTATGFRFESGFSLSLGGLDAWVESVSGDGTSATVVLPAGQTGNPVVSGVHLSFLESVSLSDIPGAASVTTPTTAWNGSAPDGAAPTINASAPGTPVTFWDTWINASTSGPGPDFFAGSTKFYRLVIPSGETRTYNVNWTPGPGGADLDVVISPTTDPGDATHGVLTGNRPEAFSATLAPGTYWISIGNWQDFDQPGVVRIVVE